MLMLFPFVRHSHVLTNPIGRKRLPLNKVLRDLCFSGRISEAVDLLCCCCCCCCFIRAGGGGGSAVDSQTYAFLLQETINRSESKLGRRIHSQMLTAGFSPDLYLTTKLIVFYAKDGDLDSAHHLFDTIPHRNLVSWNAMISGYVRKGLEQDGLNLYHSMRSAAALNPDQFTFASVFRACARLAKLDQGKRAHCLLIKSLLKPNVVIAGALIDMYFKCCSPCDGHRVFQSSSERNVVTWTALISGYGHIGKVEEVLHLFRRMVEQGFRPNSITFLALLSACSHGGGLVGAGLKYFYSMERDYLIRPKGEHYAAVVDMLGRAGLLDEAYEFVRKSPCKGHSVIWGALLGACRMHGDGVLANLAAKKFFELQPGNAGKYVVLSNTYAALEMWDKVADVRRKVGALGIRKEPAWSSVEVKGEVRTFLVGDKSHRECEMIYETTNALTCLLMEAGQFPE